MSTTESSEAPSRTDTAGTRTDAASPNRRERLVVGALLLALIAGVVFAVLQARTWKDNRTADRDRTHAIATAKKVTLALSQINFKTANKDISGILDLTTGPLRKTVLKNGKMQSQIAKQYKVKSTAKVEQAGMVKQAPNSAVVAVAVSSHVRNAKSKSATAHWFRVKVSVEKQSNGRWLASNVEFVQ